MTDLSKAASDLLALREGMTPGPWTFFQGYNGDQAYFGVNHSRSGDVCEASNAKHFPNRAIGNCKAIAAVHEMLDLIEAQAAEIEALRKWAELAELIMQPWPDFIDLNGFDLQDFAIRCGVLVEVPGGYDPESHIDTVGVAPERGDPWLKIIRFPHTALKKQTP